MRLAFSSPASFSAAFHTLSHSSSIIISLSTKPLLQDIRPVLEHKSKDYRQKSRRCRSAEYQQCFFRLGFLLRRLRDVEHLDRRTVFRLLKPRHLILLDEELIERFLHLCVPQKAGVLNRQGRHPGGRYEDVLAERSS